MYIFLVSYVAVINLEKGAPGGILEKDILLISKGSRLRDSYFKFKTNENKQILFYFKTFSFFVANRINAGMKALI